MELGGGNRRRGTGAPKEGSVWERRMKLLDELRKGEGLVAIDENSKSGNAKRKKWKSDGATPLQISISRQRSHRISSSVSQNDRRSLPVIVKINEENPKSLSRNPSSTESKSEMGVENFDDEKKKADDGEEISPVSEEKKNPIVVTESYHGIILQRYVDLIMWRDASKSAFACGIITFAIISTSFTDNLNSISIISVVSYLGLLYLAANFLFKSLITRSVVDHQDSKIQNNCVVVAEEDLIWVVKQMLPFLNEFLLKLRALFSGEPATTMKMAVLLFVLAQYGSSITMMKMVKLGFVAVFTLPKLCTSYSSHFSAQGRFWTRRFRDAWESCSHKKVVAFVVFALVWNSMMPLVTRLWTAFMLFVAFKNYRESIVEEVSEKKISD